MQTREKKLEYLRKTIETLWHGVSDTKTGDYDKIARLYVDVLKLDKNDRDAWENLVWLLWSMSINESSEPYLVFAENKVKDYLKYNPKGYRAFEYVGQFYRVMKKDLRLAVRYYESAIRWKDAPLTTHHSLISVCEKSGDKVKAIGYCKMTLARFPNDPYTKNKLQTLTK